MCIPHEFWTELQSGEVIFIFFSLSELPCPIEKPYTLPALRDHVRALDHSATATQSHYSEESTYLMWNLSAGHD